LKEAGEFQQKFEKAFGREYTLEAENMKVCPD
jgi:hypothetical protein